MKPFRFVHTADLHLDSPFRGLAEVDSPLQPVLKEATFQAFERIIDLCLTREVDFLLIAGDLHDAANRSLRSLARLRTSFERLAEQDISVFVCHGNHDPLSGWGAKFSWPSNVHIFGAGEVQAKPVLREGGEIARIYGISYATEQVTDNLAQAFQREPEAPWAIGLLHTNVGNDHNHHNYAPCRLDDLLRSKLDYWALGHIHAHRVLNPFNPVVVYPGNPQGRHFREIGPRGCYLVEVSDVGNVGYDFIEVDVVRWHEEVVNIEGMSQLDDLLGLFESRIEEIRHQNGNRGIIVRWHIQGRGYVHRELIRPGRVEDIVSTLRDQWGNGPFFVWSESLVIDTSRELDLEALGREENLLGDFLQLSNCLNGIPDEELRQVLAPLFDDHRVARYLDPPNEIKLQQWIKAAQQMGIDSLLPSEDEGRTNAHR